MKKIDLIMKAIFEASKDDKETIFKFKETQILLKNYLKDKRVIKDFKKIYFSTQGFENYTALNNLLEEKFGLSFYYATQFDKDDVRISIKLKNKDKYMHALVAS